ncbi:MAG: GNAT family N-acetyltransferase [Flavobacteriia bacterium]|jgi:ElaA protein
MYHFQIKHFTELSTIEFHDIIQLRINVFVVEQNCPYPDLDGKDKKAYHVIGRDGFGKIVATARILSPGVSYKEVSIGRVANAESERGKGLGVQLMEECLKFIAAEFGEVSVRISAQTYLLKFYESLGFKSTGKEYLEDDIPHVEMLLEK